MAKRPKKKPRSSEVTETRRTQAKENSLIANWKLFLFQVTLIVAAGLWVFWPALHGNWLWDDPYLIPKNALVNDPAGLGKIWFEPGKLVDYFPLTVSVEWLEWQAWHNDTFNYHLTNVILHLISSFLVWRLLSKFGLRLAWLGGLLFTVHPVVVESVAWISEIKNTLSLPLFLGAMCFFIDYDLDRKRSDYLLALGLFLAAALCKTTVVMFPVVILLYAWWKRGRMDWGDLKTSAPFFAVSLGLGLTTVWFLHHHAIGHSNVVIGGFFSRIALVGLSIAFYFSKCFLPVGLLPIYPKWIVDPPSLIQFLPWPILAGSIYWLWTKRMSWGRHALLGLGFFLINLAPFVGFIAGSYMDFTWVMDHLLYLPLIGLIGLVVAGLGQVAEQFPTSIRPFNIGGVTIVTMLLAWESHGYTKIFVNEKTYWTYTIQHNPNAWLALSNLGFALFQEDRIPEAIDYFDQAIRLNPDYADARYNLGSVLLKMGRIPEAIEQFEQTIRINPDYAEAHYNLGMALLQTDRVSEVIQQFEEAIKIDPNYVDAHNNLGIVLFRTGHLPEAIEQYQQAVRINPNFAQAHNNLGTALIQAKRIPEAIDQYEQALGIDPSYATAHTNLGLSLIQVKRIPEGIEQLEQALKLDPNQTDARKNLDVLRNFLNPSP